jgi:hypothetical protein
MIFLLNMVVFHSYVILAKGRHIIGEGANLALISVDATSQKPELFDTHPVVS